MIQQDFGRTNSGRKTEPQVGKESPMNLQIDRVSQAGTREQLKKQYLAAVCGAALVVAAVAGLGAWQTAAHQSASRVANPLVSAATSAATGAVDASQYPTFYLVDSQAQADSLQPLAPGSEVFVISSSEDAAAAWGGINEDAVQRTAMGLHAARIIDLRAGQ